MKLRLAGLLLLAVGSQLITRLLLQTPPESLQGFGGFLLVVKNYHGAFSIPWSPWLFWPLMIVVIGYEAWARERGDANITIAVIDTGVDWTHFDLQANIWKNPNETANDGIDNDGNGFTDDIRGWDFVKVPSEIANLCSSQEDCTEEDNDPNDKVGHGTHVAGIAAGVANNKIGIAGLCQKCTIMPIRIGWLGIANGGHVAVSDAVKAIIYATNNGADIFNMSGGFCLPVFLKRGYVVGLNGHPIDTLPKKEEAIQKALHTAIIGIDSKAIRSRLGIIE
jgi:subtilisin family serine protease